MTLVSYCFVLLFVVFVIEPCSSKFFSNSINRIVTKLSKFRSNAIAIDRDVKIPSGTKAKQPLNVRIDDTWYDLSGWRKAHPSGEHWIDLYRGRDATEVMHAFHSDKGRGMYARLPKSKNQEDLNTECAPVTQLQRNFRAFRQQLEAEGWWNRDIFHEAKLLGIWFCLNACGFLLAQSVPLLAVLLLALGQTTAGWLGHDYAHGVDKFSFSLKYFGSFAGGLSTTWWSDKHNKHHAVTNEIGVDEDLATDPFLYVYPPNPSRDSPIRKFQHLIFPIPLSLLFFVWKIDSLALCVKDGLTGFKRGTHPELGLILAHYAILASFIPLPLIIAYTFLSGLITATIVTVTHQSEELFEEHVPDFVDAQFRSTRDAKCRNPITEWVWGGMQYQLEHHLFPSMPRSKYPALAPIVKKFAEDNNVEYRITDEWDLIKMNIGTYAKMSSIPNSPTSKHYESKTTNWGGRGEQVV